ncbi:MAG: hypothetical protein LBP24_02440 [Coriobacteriales bacterium]|jgi:hypothetical protein|nr:hypothetical protein [Coriobacteriales bacterium]
MKYFVNAPLGEYYEEDAWDFWDALYWDRRHRYYKYLAAFSDRLEGQAFEHLHTRSLHDSKLERMELARKGSKLQLELELSNWVLGYGIGRYRLLFTDVISFEVKAEKDYYHGLGLEEWIEAELLPLDDETLSLEMLFASGTTFLITLPNNTLRLERLPSTLPEGCCWKDGKLARKAEVTDKEASS